MVAVPDSFSVTMEPFVCFHSSSKIAEMTICKNFLQSLRNYTLRKKCPYSELYWSILFLHFPVFELNTERYGVSFRMRNMREKCGAE